MTRTLAYAREITELLARKRAVDSRIRDDGELASRLRELRAWQAARFAKTYEDLRRDARYSDAVQFFLSYVYGAQDFSRRDRELDRALSYLGRVLPDAALGVLTRSIELDVLTIELDEAMAARLLPGPVTTEAYLSAYRAVGQRAARDRQVELLLAIIAGLDNVARHEGIGLALRAACLPARFAGFGALQEFLERGFTVFYRMHGTERLQRAIREREGAFVRATLDG